MKLISSFFKRFYGSIITVLTFFAYLTSVQLAVANGLETIGATVVGNLVLILGASSVYIIERRSKTYIQPISDADIKTDYHKVIRRCFELLFVVWFLGQFVFIYVYNKFGDSSYTNNYEKLLTNPVNVVLTFALLCFIAPIAEELFFRYLLFGRPIYKRGGHQPLLPKYIFWYVVSTSLFALLHGTLVHLIVVVPMGMIMGMLMYKTNRIAYPIVGHIMFNGLSVFMGGIVNEYKKMIEHPELVTAGLIAYGCVVLYIFYFVGKQYKN